MENKETPSAESPNLSSLSPTNESLNHLESSRLECDILASDSETLSGELLHFAQRLTSMAHDCEILSKEFKLMSDKFNNLKRKKDTLESRHNSNHSNLVHQHRKMSFSFCARTPNSRSIESVGDGSLRGVSPLTTSRASITSALPKEEVLNTEKTMVLPERLAEALPDKPEDPIACAMLDGKQITLDKDEAFSSSFKNMFDVIIRKFFEKYAIPTDNFCEGCAFIVGSEQFIRKLNDSSNIPTNVIDMIKKYKKVYIILHKECSCLSNQQTNSQHIIT